MFIQKEQSRLRDDSLLSFKCKENEWVKLLDGEGG